MWILLAALATVTLCAAGASPVARLAARRAAAQPADCEPGAEAVVVATLAEHPRWYPYVAALEPEDFTTAELSAAWAALADACVAARPDETTPRRNWETHLREREGLVPDQAAALLAPVADSAVTPAASTKALVKAGALVLSAAEARSGLTGAVPLVAGDPSKGEPAYYRAVSPVTRKRVIVTGMLLAAGMAAALVLTAMSANTVTGGILTAAGVAVLTVGATVWALVDYDTMYIDTPTLWPTAGIAGALTSAGALLDGAPERILVGVLSATAVVLVLEGANAAYRLVRGRWGLGGGDSQLAVATVGVPVIASGSWLLGYGAVMASLGLALAGWLVTAVRKKTRAALPFAFGPYLAFGWTVAVIAGALLLTTSGQSL